MTPETTSGNDPRIATEQVHVTVRLRTGVEVDGHVHVRPDNYQGRVSDLLNRANFSFLPVTGATMTRLDGSRHEAGCILVGTEDVELVICHDEEDYPTLVPVSDDQG